MRMTLKTDRRGFTIIEMAFVVLILGLAMAAAIPIYDSYTRFQRDTQTNTAMREASVSLGTFRSVFNRYPCPANPNLAPGAPEYGYEVANCDITPAGPSNPLTVATSVRTPTLTNPNVVIGMLPFRSLNIPEMDTRDGLKNRLTYAVTASLTNTATYSVENGGISARDTTTAANNKLEEPDSAHFVLIAHGDNADGAYSNSGVRVGSCASALALDQENCDGDSIFLQGPPAVSLVPSASDFDDFLTYFSDIETTPWQYAAINNQDIHLREASIAGGANQAILTQEVTPNLGAVVELEVRSPNAAITAERFLSQQICIENPTTTTDGERIECFEPEDIGGTLANGGGLNCPNGFLIAIENGAPVCRDTIEFSCPEPDNDDTTTDTPHIVGINPDGSLICGTTPSAPCPSTSMPTSCGPNQTLPETAGGQFAQAFSGSVYRIPTSSQISAATFNAQVTANAGNETGFISEMTTLINASNAAARATPVDQDLIRDRYQCVNGTFEHKERIEHGSANSSAPHWNSIDFQTAPLVTSTSDPRVADAFPGAAFSITAAHNTSDCWCREDYRLVTFNTGCPNGLGNRYFLERRACAQTVDSGTGRWITVATTNAFCGCTTVVGPTNTECDLDDDNELNGSLTGQITQARTRECSNLTTNGTIRNLCGDVATTDPCPDKSQCACPYREPLVTTITCAESVECILNETCPAAAYTSTLSYGGVNNLTSLKIDPWVCDGQIPTPNNPIRPATSGGEYDTSSDPVTAECTCNNITERRTSPCPLNQAGLITEDFTFNCSTNTETKVPVTNTCQTCTFVPDGAVITSPVASPNTVGSSCTCGQRGPCSVPRADGQYNVFQSCECRIN